MKPVVILAACIDSKQLSCVCIQLLLLRQSSAAIFCLFVSLRYRPNCEAKSWMVGTVSRHVVICAARDIAAGEELT
jgi:SET domain-containing protein